VLQAEPLLLTVARQLGFGDLGPWAWRAFPPTRPCGWGVAPQPRVAAALSSARRWFSARFSASSSWRRAERGLGPSSWPPTHSDPHMMCTQPVPARKPINPIHTRPIKPHATTRPKIPTWPRPTSRAITVRELTGGEEGRGPRWGSRVEGRKDRSIHILSVNCGTCMEVSRVNTHLTLMV
jgi:hypothetical protein